jgi:hypothetical protein
VALPGPNDEVKDSVEVLMNGLKSHLSKNLLAEDLADNLRKRLRDHRGLKEGAGQIDPVSPKPEKGPLEER